MRHKVDIFFISSILLICVSCESTKNCILSCTNSTEYIFNYNLDDTKSAIQSCLGKNQFYGLDLGYKDNVMLSNIFEVDSFKNDFVIEIFSGSSFLKSKIYYKTTGEPYEYFASFHLHLTRVSNDKTKVNVKVYNPEIIGTALLPMPPNFNRGFIINVPPSTVEEYEILLRIGRELNLNDMPQIKIPKRIVINEPFKIVGNTNPQKSYNIVLANPVLSD